jgi:hypothetical protein
MGAKGGGWVGVEGLNAHTSMIQKYGLPVRGGGPLDTVAGWGGSGAASLVWGVPPISARNWLVFMRIGHGLRSTPMILHKLAEDNRQQRTYGRWHRPALVVEETMKPLCAEER